MSTNLTPEGTRYQGLQYCQLITFVCHFSGVGFLPFHLLSSQDLHAAHWCTAGSDQGENGLVGGRGDYSTFTLHAYREMVKGGWTNFAGERNGVRYDSQTPLHSFFFLFVLFHIAFQFLDHAKNPTNV